LSIRNWPRLEDDVSNFAGRIVLRIGENASLIDAPAGMEYRGTEIRDRIAGFASGFLEAGLRPGDRILIRCGITVSSALAYLGAMYAGMVPVPVEDRLFETFRDGLILKARPRAIWAVRSELCEDTAQEVQQLAGDFPPRDYNSLPPAKCSEEDLATLMFTSGSTGMPRLVMVSHGNLRANTEAIILSQGLGTDERAMLIMPIAYCFGASVMHTHLYQGGGVVFDPRFMFPDKVLHAINRYECTTFAGVPAVFNVLLRRSNLSTISLPSLRRFLQAGGALGPEGVRRMREIVPTADFMVMYGQTEATARISCWTADCSSEKLGSVGLPLHNLEVRIADAEGRELPPATTGEIQARGASVCAGYFDDPEATADRFIDGWLRTGDYGMRDEDGYLWVKGRTDDFIKISGRRISVGEIESKVASIAGVSDCAAVPVPDRETGEAIALFVVPSNGATGLPEAIRRNLPPHWTCASIEVVEDLPRTSSGKVARNELRVKS